MFRKALLTTAATIAIFVLSSAARADVIVPITGNSTGNQSTGTVSVSFNDLTNTFTFTITNTSPFDARITGIGFDLGSGNVNGFSSSNVAGFSFSDGNLGNVPQFNSAVLDFGYTTGPSGNFNGGSPNNGLAPGSSLTFTVSGAGFGNGLTEQQLASAIYVRYQRVGANGEGSDVGRPGMPSSVPEPMTMLLFGTGLAGIAARARRRKTKA